MKNKVSCRACQIENDLLARYDRTHNQHELVDVGIYCLVCKFSGAFSLHIEKDLLGESWCCTNCNNYILYTDKNQIWKDEIYFPDEISLIRNLEENESTIGSSYKEIVTINSMVSFDSIEALQKKLKTLVLFS